MIIMCEQEYLDILNQELMPALGCTEPIAIAYAAATARDVLGVFPEHIDLFCSGNIIKNVSGVVVPNSNGMRGIDAAGTLGIVCGRAESRLQVLENATEEDVFRTKQLLQQGFAKCYLQEGVENLYVRAIVYSGNNQAEVIIEKHHTDITYIAKNGVILEDHQKKEHASDAALTELTVLGILDFSESVNTDKVKKLLDQQISMNMAIAHEGIKNTYGVSVGQTLLHTEGCSLSVRARALAAAGSDARMDGCSLPVMINSGSGNQGMTLSIPVIEYAKELNVGDTKLYRALLISNLISIHIKRQIGSLSAFCGAVSAACGAGAAITYLYGGNYDQICSTIVNTLGTTTGIVCDGAKASCAAKISCALESAITAHHMSMEKKRFLANTGLIKGDIEDTIRCVGCVGRDGMRETDVQIMNIMLRNTPDIKK